jgi:hypothetical protein
MPEFDPDDFPSTDAYFELFGVDDTAMCAQFASRTLDHGVLAYARQGAQATNA